jgi:hypothetical protein
LPVKGLKQGVIEMLDLDVGEDCLLDIFLFKGVIRSLDYGIAFSVVSSKSVSVLKLFVREFWTEV